MLFSFNIAVFKPPEQDGRAEMEVWMQQWDLAFPQYVCPSIFHWKSIIQVFVYSANTSDSVRLVWACSVENWKNYAMFVQKLTNM